MLTNPNLSVEKMFEVLASGIEIVGYLGTLLGVLLLYIYRYEIGLFIKYGFSKDKKPTPFNKVSQLINTDFSELEKTDLNNKVDSLLNKFNNASPNEDNKIQIIDNIDDNIHPNESIPPNFRSLKTITNSNKITYHFVNDGGSIHNFSASSSDEIIIIFSNKEKIELNESGYIKFELPNNYTKDFFNFELDYYNDLDKLHKIKYSYSLTKNSLLLVE